MHRRYAGDRLLSCADSLNFAMYDLNHEPFRFIFFVACQLIRSSKQCIGRYDVHAKRLPGCQCCPVFDQSPADIKAQCRHNRNCVLAAMHLYILRIRVQQRAALAAWHVLFWGIMAKSIPAVPDLLLQSTLN